MEQLVTWANKAYKVLREIEEQQDHQDPRVQLELMDLWVPKDSKDQLVLLELREILVQLDQQDLLDHKEHLEIQDQLDHKASLATKDKREFWVRKVFRELQACRVQLVNQVKLVLRDSPVKQEFRAGLD